MTCLHGASLAEMTLGKKLPTSASMGSIFKFVEEALGGLISSRARMRSAMSSRESVSRARRSCGARCRTGSSGPGRRDGL